MLTIIEIKDREDGGHGLQSQSHRTECWLEGWIARGWITSAKKPVKNRDLWERMAVLLKMHRVSFHWLKGHAGHRENERCDELARTESAKRELPPDPGFPGN